VEEEESLGDGLVTVSVCLTSKEGWRGVRGGVGMEDGGVGA